MGDHVERKFSKNKTKHRDIDIVDRMKKSAYRKQRQELEEKRQYEWATCDTDDDYDDYDELN